MKLLYVIALATLVGSASNRPAAQSVTFRTATDVVQIDVSVVGGRAPVEGLEAADFQLSDNGVPQEVRAVAFDEVPINLALVLDTSGSVDGQRLEGLRRAAAHVVDLLRPSDAAGLITFGAQVQMRQDLTSDTAALRRAITAIDSGEGETALRDAIYAGLLLLDDQPGRPVVMVFSDGQDIGSILDEEQLRGAVARTRPVVYAVTPKQSADMDTLDDLCRASGGERLALDESGDLGASFARILMNARRRYLLSYTPVGVDRGGWHDVTVTVPATPDAEIDARPGYFVTP